MKKSIFLATLLVILIIAGCNQKDLVKQIDGNWHIQSYALNGVDETHWFDTTYANFQWTFSGSTNFSQTYQYIKLYTLNTRDTIAHYDTTTHALVIDSITISTATVPTTTPVTIQGQWYFTNGNEYLETNDSVNGNILYQIISHSHSNLHLLNGNKDYYLSK